MLAPRGAVPTAARRCFFHHKKNYILRRASCRPTCTRCDIGKYMRVGNLRIAPPAADLRASQPRRTASFPHQLLKRKTNTSFNRPARNASARLGWPQKIICLRYLTFHLPNFFTCLNFFTTYFPLPIAYLPVFFFSFTIVPFISCILEH